MTAICKTIAVHSKSASPLMKYCSNEHKTSVSRNADSVEALLNYGGDPLKTICGIDENHKELLITGIKCTPETAAEEFSFTRERYLSIKGSTEEFDKNYNPDKGKKKREAITAIHLIQSFKETDIEPHIAHEIGVRLAESFGCQAVIDTHMNRDHIHNHIILNSYMENGKKVSLNKDVILNIRELSDEIQKEYGIPIEFENPRDQLRHKQRGTIDRKEWELTMEGKSWKDQMREDIAAIAEVAQNREEYLQLMESYGYSVEKETPKNITFRVKENGKKIKDNTLGEDYTIGNLYPPNKEKDREKHFERSAHSPQYSPLFGKPISIAKYDANGRRRGLLELLIRKAIAIIQRIGNFFFDDRYSNYKNSYNSPQYKIDLLNNAIDIIRKYDVEGSKDLERQTEATATTLSHAKRNLRIAEIEKALIDMAENAVTDIEMLSMVKTNIGELHLHEYSNEEIRKTKASFAPMTSKQKKDLSRELAKHENYRLTCRFDEISCSDAEKLLGYFNGKEKYKPEILLTKDEYQKRSLLKQADSIYEKQIDRLKEKYAGESPKETQLNQALKILELRGIAIDKNALSQYDVMSIRNCFGENPFISPVISEPQKKLLEEKVKELGVELNRKPEFITANEFNHFMRYIDKKTKAKPSFIGEREDPNEEDVKRLGAIMKAKEIEATVPLKELSKNDFNKLYSYAIYQGHIPEVLEPVGNEDNSDRDNLFYARVSNYDVSRSLHLAQLRNAYNTLRSLGFDVKQGDDLGYIREVIDDWNKSYEGIVKEKEKLAEKYSDLLKVKRASKLATTPSFLYGDLFNPDVDKEVPVVEKDERDTRSEEEDKKWRHMEKEPGGPSL